MELRKSESIEAAIRNLEQLDLPGTSLMSLLQLGSGMQLKHAQQQNRFMVTDLQRKLWSRLRESKIEMIEQLIIDVWAA